MVLICVSVKRKLGNLGLFLIVVATGLQNAVAAAATTTSTALLGGWILSLFWFPSILLSYGSIIERRSVVGQHFLLLLVRRCKKKILRC
jgi:hypothetical protein